MPPSSSHLCPQIWRLETDEGGAPSVTFLASLDRHTKSVNVVRFSPNGAPLSVVIKPAVRIQMAVSVVMVTNVCEVLF
jgi:hypothetical protein